ncbi:MAG: DNA-formamidopyrimidine glycosylase [Bacilli bacterium]|nr:DNA-formamidopyrimidine glycosylase [Bacilli bacterium]
MPELPEVETVRRLLEKTVVGKQISSIELFRAKNVATDPKEFLAVIPGKTITRIIRKGKLLGFVFDEDYILTSHLRMEGKYFFHADVRPRGKHDIFRFLFRDGSELVYNDVRKFGRVGLYPLEGYQKHSPFAELGPEPFDMKPEELLAQLKGRNLPIKQCIMDQSIVSGIGNIYADESLFASHVHPLEKAKNVSLEQCQAILTNASRIMNESIEEGGSTVRSYHPGEGIDGLMQLRLQVYGKEGESCPRCGFPLNRITVNGRGTTYCPKCQKSLQIPFVLGLTGPIHSGKSTAASYFVSQGYAHFDADVVAKNAYFDLAVKKAVIHLLGRKAYEGKNLNAAYVREKLTAKPSLKKELEAIVHPYVIAKAREFIAASKDKVLLDVPLLFPSHMDELCDATLLILAPLELRAKRIEDEGRDASRLLAINRDYPLEEAKRKARFIVDNDAGLEEFYSRLKELPL